MRIRIAVLLGLLAGFAAPAQALDTGFMADGADLILQRVGFGMRLDFGAAERPPLASFALTTTREFVNREVTFPLFAIDLGGGGPRLGTVMGIAVLPPALRHRLRVVSTDPLLRQRQGMR